MNVYELVNDYDRFAILVNSPNSTSAGLQLDNTPAGEPCRDWKLPRYEAQNPRAVDYPGPMPEGDFVGVGLAEIGLRMTAKVAMGDVFERDGELLPVQVGDDKQAVWVFHCLTVIDVTDRRNRATDVRHIGASNRWVDGRPEGVAPRAILQAFWGLVCLLR